jgi:hypothetical protein
MEGTPKHSLGNPPTYHIELGLDHTKLWYVDDQAVELTELPFYPTIDEIFGELAR